MMFITRAVCLDGDWLQRTPKFVHDTSKFWYKPFISREDGEHNVCFVNLFSFVYGQL
jgi:hypothetical protein